jgi:hypothetical protein
MSRASTPATTLEGLSKAELAARLRAARDQSRGLERELAKHDNEITRLKGRSADALAAVEVEEERMSNTLIKRMDSLRKSNVEVEEAIKAHERRNSAVLAELARVRKSKVEVENRIEAEQERMLNTLQRQLLSLAAEKTGLEKQLQVSREQVLSSLHAEVERLRQRSDPSTSCDEGVVSGSSARAASVSGDGGLRGGSSPCGVKELEVALRKMVDETRDSQRQCEEASAQCETLANQLRTLQNESLISRSRAAKMREELEKAHVDLATEQASTVATPMPSAEATPIVHPRGEGAGGLGVPPPAGSRRRSSHMRTHSGSSVESWSSASVASVAPVIALARQDPDVVRQHTARVLSSAATVYPSPRRAERAPSASRSGRSSAAPSAQHA